MEVFIVKFALNAVAFIMFRLLLSLWVLVIPCAAFALDASVSKSFFFEKNPATGAFDASLNLYWQVNPRTVHFATTPEKTIVGRIRTDIVISRDGATVAEDHFILQTQPVLIPDELATLNIMDLRKYKAVPGTLHISVLMTDVNDTGNKYAYADSVQIKPLASAPFYSDVQLLDTFFSLSTSSLFLADGRQAIPICADFVDDYRRRLHYRIALYNLEAVKKDAYPLVHKVRLARKVNDAFLADTVISDTITHLRYPVPFGSLPIGALKSGNYYLVATLEDKSGNLLASSHRFFQRMNLHPDKPQVAQKSMAQVLNDTAMEQITVVNLDKSFLAKYNMSQIRAMLKMLLPISTPMQANTINGFLKKPEEMYMRYFIHNYFQEINPGDPAKAWKEYSEKVREVNKKFTAAGTAGYETERGFIYLRYGPPTDIVTVNSETGALPYEIWQYNTLTQFSNKKELANALFLFYKPGQMVSDYRLLHSTVPGEVRNASWRMYLYSTTSSSSGGINTNSRAEQYIGNQ